MNNVIKKSICVSSGNTKLGKVKNFSLPSGISCPGKSSWCENCYANRYEKRYKTCRESYDRNLKYSKESFFSELLIDRLTELPGYDVRIHPSGDFYSVDYIDKWIEVCKKMNNHDFWCYTRSWIVPELLKKIRELNKLDNVQIFLSTDPTMYIPPSDFRIAFIKDDERSNGIVCFHDEGVKHTCSECGYCFKNKKGNVVFKNKMKKEG